ncbi:pig-X [Schizosaccharomyces japonicus yFS275]|uniref:Protein PBN1 n=1 Tax=Schizosaccharomyces japonicus (strain yFS275 / FY16936) TaxID=402676 RepID=B6K535_SCHJY|nr:pig-X [Schizosaccharomyces japonicus yFS275]EEB08639.1 pig-X [Schizosaccharomyces japonicus yFS275]
MNKNDNERPIELPFQGEIDWKKEIHVGNSSLIYTDTSCTLDEHISRFTYNEKSKWLSSEGRVPKGDSVVGTYTSAFRQPPGLHPTLVLHVSKSVTPPGKCQMQVLAAIPSTLFVDKYQLTSLAEKDIKNVHELVELVGETDLEAPSYNVPGWGSVLLLDVNAPLNMDEFDIEIPLHTRYQLPQEDGMFHVASMQSPTVFWSCGEHVDSVEQLLSREKLEEPAGTFVLDYVESSLNVLIPTADAKKETEVSILTNAVVSAGFIYLVVVLLRQLWKPKED